MDADGIVGAVEAIGELSDLIAVAKGDHPDQLRRIIADNIDSSSIVIADPTSSVSCRLLKDALDDLEIEAASIRCFDGRVVRGVACYGVPYAILDFQTRMDALIVVRQPGRYDPERMWLAQFSGSALEDLAAQLDLLEN